MSDAVAISLLLHLLLAFPSGRLEGRAERRVAALGYVSAVVQPLRILVLAVRRRRPARAATRC